MKANHNPNSVDFPTPSGVSNNAKLLKWKQITTVVTRLLFESRCFQQCKVTKMKANHNVLRGRRRGAVGVSNNAKLLKWKQITTPVHTKALAFPVFPTMQSY